MVRRGWWHTPALILLAAVLLVVLWFVQGKDRTEKLKRDRIEEQAASLEKQRNQLVKERDMLQQWYQEQSKISATEQLLFLELDEQLYTEVYPIMKHAGVPGVLGLSEGNFPGDPGKISREVFDALLKDGWSLCMVYEGEDSFADWDQKISGLLSDADIPKPETVYFPTNTFDLTMTQDIQHAGYRIAIHHGENRLEMIAGDAVDALWLVGAHPWNYDGVRTHIRENVRRSGECCFTIRFSNGLGVFDSRAFDNMLKFLESFRTAGDLKVTSFSEARLLHDPVQNGTKELRETWEKKDAELFARIRALEEQIQAVYEAWNKD